jgi:hypothetical protein
MIVVCTPVAKCLFLCFYHADSCRVYVLSEFGGWVMGKEKQILFDG